MFKVACLLALIMLLPVALLPKHTAAQTNATISVAPDDRGQTTISVSGTGSSVTLPQIQAALGSQAALLTNEGTTWQLNANLLIGRAVTLTLNLASGVETLRLRSEASAEPPNPSPYDYASFVYLRSDNGTIMLDGVRVYSWDSTSNSFDTDPGNGRSYLLAKFNARLDINNAELSYLGSGDGESYGVSWRDINDPAQPNALRTRVTGRVTGSRFHHNYYGVYTFQASNMLFSGNQFYQNISYGFDPHDFTHHVLVENNIAYENGNHGFIISRGCNNFVFRGNIAYGNNNPDPASLGHGFMLDAGSPASSDPQAPSFNNLLEENYAYDNEGYGLRILGSSDNVVRNNRFERNQQGITVEQGSTGNTLSGNVVSNSRLHGIFVRGGADNTTISANTIAGSGTHGIYIKSNNNSLNGNTISSSQGSGIAALPETTAAAARADLQGQDAERGSRPIDPELVGEVVAQATLEGNKFSGNSVSGNARHGFELKSLNQSLLEQNTVAQNGAHGIYLAEGSSDTRVVHNSVASNAGEGIRVNGAESVRNSWSENSIYANTAGGIRVTAGANAQIAPPVIEPVADGSIRGRATPGALIEVFSDSAQQSRYFLGRTTAQPDGRFTLAIEPVAATITATATDAAGNSSALAIAPAAASSAQIIYLPLVVR